MCVRSNFLCVAHSVITQANVLVDSGCKAYLTDFGISTIMRNNATASGTGTVRGTPGWIAPELGIISEAAINPSPASDIYSLGMLVWEVSFPMSLISLLSRTHASGGLSRCTRENLLSTT